MLNNLHLSVVGTTSMAARFIAPAILILQILICSVQLGIDVIVSAKLQPIPRGDNVYLFECLETRDWL